MSDQVSQEFNTQVSLPSGTGITSINGDGTPAQLIVASAGITVGSAAGTTSVGNAGVLSVAKQGSPPRTGAIVLKPSASVSIVEAPNGTYEFDAIGAAGIVSINADVTPAQVLAAGAGISITPGPAGTNTIAATGAGLGVVSINADVTAAQLLTGINGIDIADAGGGLHTVRSPTFKQFGGFLAAGTALPNGVLVPLATAAPVAVGNAGTYWVGYTAGVNGIAAQLFDTVLRVNGVLDPFAGTTGFVETAGQQLKVNGTGGTFVVLAVGDIVDVAVNHHGGGAASTALQSTVYGFKVSN